MKLRTLFVRNFRGFSKGVRFEFGDTNLFGGPNGTGKTSLFDAIQWCLFGSVPRLSGTRDFSRVANVLQNRFSKEPTLVSLEFVNDTGETLGVERTLYRSSFRVNENEVDEDNFLALLGIAGDEGQSMFLRSMMLQQERIHEFVRDLNPRRRYDALLSLLEFLAPQQVIEVIRNLIEDVATRLSKATSNLNSIQKRRETLENDISGLEKVKGRFNSHLIHKDTEELMKDIGSDTLECLDITDATLSDRPTVDILGLLVERLHLALKQFRELTGRIDRLKPLVDQGLLEVDERSVRDQLDAEKQGVNKTQRKLEELAEKAAKLKPQLETIQGNLNLAKQSADKVQMILAEVPDIITTDACPICKRPIPRSSLLEILDKEIDTIGRALSKTIAERDSVQARLMDLGRDREKLHLALEDHKKRVAELTDAISRRQQLISSFRELRSRQIVVRWHLEQEDFKAFAALCRDECERTEALHSRAIHLSGLLEQVRSTHVLPRKYDDRSAIRQEEERIIKIKHTAEEGLERLRRYETAILHTRASMVHKVLDSYKPLIQALYRRFQPHPLFTEIDFEVVEAYKEAELYFKVYTAGRKVEAYPSTVFSESQLNALAVCIFLALNLRAGVPLSLMILDDPIQTMDDINVLGFCEIARQMRARRQLFISTHEKALYGLLLNKLRPAGPSDVVKGFWFETWSEMGPSIREDPVEFISSDLDLNYVDTVTRSVPQAS